MNEVERYIDTFDGEIKERLEVLRKEIKAVAPEASERICMGIPTFDLNGKWFVHFAGFKKHIGFYPDPETILAFQEQLKGYKTSKGTVQFPLDRPLPMDLIEKMIRYRKRSMEKASA